MSALAIPVPRSSASDEAPCPDGELSLAELLDLVGTAESVAADRPAARERTPLRARLREWVRRAAGWGARPAGRLAGLVSARRTADGVLTGIEGATS